VNALYRTGLPCARCCGEIEGAAPVAYLIRVFVVLAKAGTQRGALACTERQLLERQLIIEIAPVRIMTLDQFEFPYPPPFLEPLFARDGGHYGVMELNKDQPMDTVVLNNPSIAFDRCARCGAPSRLSLRYKASRCVRSRRCSRMVASGSSVKPRLWVPAFARTTKIISVCYFSCMTQTPSHPSSGGLV
jgi:hypothetical protein